MANRVHRQTPQAPFVGGVSTDDLLLVVAMTDKLLFVFSAVLAGYLCSLLAS